MQHPGYDDDALNTFLADVQAKGGITTRIEADSATRATLATLAEAASSGQMNDVGANLPAQLRDELHHPHRQQARSLGKQEFVDHVGGMLDAVDPETVEARVRAVFAAIAKWVPDDEVANTRAQLPTDLAALFPANPAQ